jgi:hypothetical protein
MISSHGGRSESSVSDDPHIDLAAFDELFGNGMIVGRAMNELHAFGELLIVMDDRCLRNADRALFDNRFDEQWKFQATGRTTFCPM